jgi:cyclopropane fatty-acyl-phospholipid synthase-like methyltransferase
MTSEADRIVSLYERHAAEWDKRRRADAVLEKAWLDRFTALLAPGATILDIGCGSGQPIGRYLIEQGFDVTGVDSSPALIELCRQRFPNREWLVADMRTLALGRAFHGLIAWDSFFHLSPGDQRRMFPIFRAHAAPGAALMFTSGSAHGEAIGEFHGEPLYHASLAPTEYSDLLAANGFAVETFDPDDPSCGHHAVWLARAPHGGSRL